MTVTDLQRQQAKTPRHTTKTKTGVKAASNTSILTGGKACTKVSILRKDIASLNTTSKSGCRGEPNCLLGWAIRSGSCQTEPGWGMDRLRWKKRRVLLQQILSWEGGGEEPMKNSWDYGTHKEQEEWERGGWGEEETTDTVSSQQSYRSN